MTHPVRDDIDLLDGAWYAAQPYEQWAWMLEHAPVYYDEANDVWAICRHQDVLAVEKDPGTFSSKRAPRPHGDPLPMMISLDDPDHQRRRSLVNRGFTPRRVATHEDTIRRMCTAILDRVTERGECDFVRDVAAPLPLMLIADMLGFGPDAHDDLLRWSDDLIKGTTTNPSPEVQAASLEASLGFRAYQREIIADRRSRPPQGDLVSILCHAEVDGHQLDDESLIMETLLILIGGDETSRHVISGGALALMDAPDQRQVLLEEPDALDTAVEELLRWVSPIKNMSRTVTRDIELRGERVREGDQVMLLYPAANRDPRVFAKPEHLDVRRHPNPHLAFGFGPHFCLGASLARLELRVMLGEVLRRMPDLELAADHPVPYRRSNFITGPESMPVRFTPTPAVGNGA